MRLIRAKNYDDMSLKAANIIAAQVSLNPKSVLGLATGSTPIGTYRHLVEWYQKGELDFGKAVSIRGRARSCQYGVHLPIRPFLRRFPCLPRLLTSSDLSAILIFSWRSFGIRRIEWEETC